MGEETRRRARINAEARNVTLERAKAAEGTLETISWAAQTMILTFRRAFKERKLPPELKALINRAMIVVANTDRELCLALGKPYQHSAYAPEEPEEATLLVMIMVMLKTLNATALEDILEFIDPSTREPFLTKIRNMTDEQFKDWITNYKNRMEANTRSHP